MTYKIIFLDIDGVLITGNSLKESYENRNDKVSGLLQVSKLTIDNIFDKHCVSNLINLCSLCEDIKLVMSSTWRLQKETPNVMKKLNLYQFFLHEAWRTEYDSLSKSKEQRPIEINNWLKQNKKLCKDYIIIDDDSFDWNLSQRKRWIQTSFNTGFATVKMLRAIDMLGIKE